MQMYLFGFLNRDVAYTLPGVAIRPHDQFDFEKELVMQYVHRDGFVYPPLEKVGKESGELVPNTERPSHLYHLPASHKLQMDSDNPGDRTEASFIIQIVGYLHETWLQFDDWWFDSRVPLSKMGLSLSLETSEHFLRHAYQTWQNWPDSVRKRFTTTLFMFNRAPSYEWDWEHFVIEYMVFDALYRTAVDLRLITAKDEKGKQIGHAKRIGHICRGLGLQENAEHAGYFAKLRNDLLHESLWDSGQPGGAGSSAAFMTQFHLRHLNQRLVLAILGYKNDFMRSGWWSLGSFTFGIPAAEN